MWRNDQAAFADRYKLSKKRARLFRATAEHLVARRDGGSDRLQNIVAACWFCNSRRHYARDPLSPNEYAIKVRAQLAKGKWHGFSVSADQAKERTFARKGKKENFQGRSD